MMWKYITTPIIGAIIGYVTNWVAVKMLFHPRREIRIFGKKLPFTPGVIPRGQKRLARGIGRVVEQQLLTPEYLERKLFSEQAEKNFKESLEAWKEKQKQSGETCRQALLKLVPEEQLDDVIFSAEEDVADFLYNKLLDMDLGKLIVDKVMEVAREKMAESMFGKMLGGSFLEKLGGQVQEKIDDYLTENARGYIESEVERESLALQEKKTAEIVTLLEEKEFCDADTLWGIYRDLLQDKLPDILAALRLSEVVEERINAMEVEEVEDLVLSIMNKELGAIVNLGALIGLLMGLVNVAILML